MRQFLMIVTTPNVKLPQSYDECENLNCGECVLYGFLEGHMCQFSSMLSQYREA